MSLRKRDGSRTVGGATTSGWRAELNVSRDLTSDSRDKGGYRTVWLNSFFEVSLLLDDRRSERLPGPVGNDRHGDPNCRFLLEPIKVALTLACTDAAEVRRNIVGRVGDIGWEGTMSEEAMSEDLIQCRPFVYHQHGHSMAPTWIRIENGIDELLCRFGDLLVLWKLVAIVPDPPAVSVVTVNTHL